MHPKLYKHASWFEASSAAVDLARISANCAEILLLLLRFPFLLRFQFRLQSLLLQYFVQPNVLSLSTLSRMPCLFSNKGSFSEVHYEHGMWLLSIAALRAAAQ